MGAGMQPEIGVRISATTSGLTAGFAEAVNVTQRGVGQMNAALASLQNATNTGNAAMARQASAFAMSTVAMQNTATTAKATAQAATMSGAAMANAASKSVGLVTALASVSTSSGSAAQKMISLGSTAALVFGPTGIAVAAVLGFAAIFTSRMAEVKRASEAARLDWQITMATFERSRDAKGINQALSDLMGGDPLSRDPNRRRGIGSIEREIASIEQGARRNLPGGGYELQLTRAQLAELEKLRATAAELRKEYDQLAPVAVRINEEEQRRLAAEKAIADALEQQKAGLKSAADAARDAAREREAVAEAEYRYMLTLAGDDLAKRREIAQAQLDVVSATYGAQSAQYLAMLTELVDLDRQYEEEQRKRRDDFEAAGDASYQAYLEQEAARIEASKAAQAAYFDGWVKVLNGVSSLVERSFAGIFAGTKTLGDAFRDLGRNLLEAMAQSVAKSLQIWIAAEITKRVYGAATAKQTVTNAAVEAGAKAFAATAGIPIIGPLLAPLAGAAAFAGVLAFGGSIASAAGGWGRVPNDQMAMVHRNEMVLPAPLAESVRQMANGGTAISGGGNVSLSVTAMDAQSFREFFGRNGTAVAEVLVEMVRNGQLALKPA